MSVVIIDAELLAEELIQSTNWFATHFNLTTPIPYTEDCGKVGLPLVTALIDDLVTARLNWGNGETDNHLAEFQKLAPWFDIGSTAAISEAYFQKVYDIFYCRVDDLISTAIPRKTWFQWSIAKTLNGIVIEKGRDHRIVEWERLTGYTRVPVKAETPSTLPGLAAPRIPTRTKVSKKVTLKYKTISSI